MTVNKIILDYWSKKIDQFDIGMDSLHQYEARPNGQFKLVVEAAKLESINAMAQQNTIAEYTIFLAIFNVLIKKNTNHENIFLLTPNVSLTNDKNIKDTLLLYNFAFKKNDTLREVLNTTKAEIETTLSYTDINFDFIQNRFQENNVQSNDFMQFGFSYAPVNIKTSLDENIKLYLSITKRGVGNFELTINYDQQKYSESYIENFANHYIKLAQNIKAFLATEINNLDLLSEQEKTTLLEFAGTIKNWEATNVISCFEEQVRQRPDKIALVQKGQFFTYASLNQKANQLAIVFKEQYQVQKGDFVAVMTDYTTDAIISFLAALKLGAAYVPFDIALPKDRVAYILNDIQAKVVVIPSSRTDELTPYDFAVYNIDTALPNEAETTINITTTDTDTLAYVMYTSGSTGNPKGVLIENKGIVRLVKDTNYINIVPEDNFLAISNYTFDGSTFDIWGALLNGASLHIPEKDLALDFELLTNTIDTLGITVAFMTTALFNTVVDEGIESVSKLRKILFGGEMISVPHAKSFIKRYGKGKLLHVYGPTENTTFSTFYPIDEVPENTYTIPIGQSISHTQCYILNEHLQLQAIGVPGELYLSGLGLAKGYLNNDTLNAERFIDNPFLENTRLYKTGDICKWLPSGDIEFIGRVDNQVKVRGFRIELGEIETRIREFENIKEAVVIVSTDQNNLKFLSAFFTANENISATDLQETLLEQMPAYMVPKHLTQVAQMPLNKNAKIDKKKLLELGKRKQGEDREIILPQTTTQKELHRLWQEMLDLEHISIKDNFFDLGGHSLWAIRLISKIHKTFNVKIELKKFFTSPVLEDLAELIDNSTKLSFIAIPPAEKKEGYPLSSSQSRLWVISQFEEASAAYNMPAVFEFKGQLNIECLHYAFDQLIQRHESLRTVFKKDETGQAIQVIRTVEEIGFKVGFHSLKDKAAQKQELKGLIKKDVSTAFDLATGPLLAAKVYELSEDKWVFIYVMHHIISDGWSMDVLINELLLFYNARLQGEKEILPSLSIQYKDYAVWEQNQLQQDQLTAHKNYWLKRFEGSLTVLPLPTDKPRPSIQTYNGDIVHTKFNAKQTQLLKAICNENGTTLFMGLLSLVKTLLYRYSNTTDIIVGTPIANREHADLEGQIGFYLNTLALRTQFNSTDSFLQLLNQIKEETLTAYKHQTYPFNELLEALDITRDMSRNALFDVMIVLQNASNRHIGQTEQGIEGLSISRYEDVSDHISKFDLSFDFQEIGEELEVYIEYNTDLFEKESANRYLTHLENLLDAILLAPQQSINAFEFISEVEKTNLLALSFGEKMKIDDTFSLIKLIEKQVAKTPDNIALIFGEKEFTYKTINSKANQLAQYLIKNYAVKANTLIGIQLERSEWMIISLLAILKTGAAYLPIDIEYPEDRKAWMINDSDCQLIIDKKEIEQFIAKANHLEDQNVNIPTKSEDLAYVIYTSGSTGKPKGVMIEHHALLDYALTFSDHFKLTQDDRIIQQSSISFDTHVEEIYPALISGCTLLMGENGGRDFIELQSLIEEKNASILSTTPQALNALNTLDINLNQLRLMISGGDKFNTSFVSNFFGKVEIYDTYGPSESTVCSTYHKVENASTNAIIGKPIRNRSIFILNEAKKLQASGITGEIAIGGMGLAKGYLNDEFLTTNKFIEHPLIEGQRIYLSGDLGRWLANGNIEFIGRKDDQVKLRGYRIELGEIESILQSHSTIKTAAALVESDEQNNKELVAYFLTDARVNATELRTHLGAHLPGYMIPTKYIQLESFPLSPNGKIDRKKLHLQSGTILESGIDYVAPSNELEEALVIIWQNLLNKEKIGIKDNFFDLGGHSLKVIQLISEIDAQFSVKINIKSIFMSPTVEGVAEQIAFVQKQQSLKANKSKLQQINIDL